MTLHMYFLIFSFLCVFVFLSREVKYRYSKQIPPKNISTNKCPPKVYLPTLMTMICVREGSTGHIPCVHYSQVGPIPLRPLLFSNYYHQDPSPLPPNYHHYHHEDHNTITIMSIITITISSSSSNTSFLFSVPIYAK